MDFDEIIDRRGTHAVKWDMMEQAFGVSPEDGIAMWVADMDFRPPACVQAAVERMAAHGVYGYFGDDRDYLAAIRWWMAERHGWEVDPAAVFTTHGLVNGTSLCIDTYTEPGDAVVLMTPVYHAFSRVIRAMGREVRSLPLAVEDGRHRMDFDRWSGLMTGRERMLLLCSPHNPGGRVWTAEELSTTAEFCARHDLVLVADEIHHDLVLPGARHVPLPLAAPEAIGYTVMMTATTKTFNIAGAHIGNVIVPDPGLRARLAARHAAWGLSPNAFGMHMATAAYSPAGAVWVDALVGYLDANRRVFDDGVNAIPGVRSMRLEGTYLAWVDFSGTGMAPAEFIARVEKGARIAANHGTAFGPGGENCLRFNLATPRARVEEAVSRLQAAFSDLQ